MRSFLFSLVFLAACAETPPPPPPIPGELAASGEVMFTVNEKPVAQNMVSAVEKRVPANRLAELKAAGQYQQFLEQIALSQVLYDKALEDKLHEKPEVKELIAMTIREALATEYLRTVSDKAVADQAVEEWYQKRKVQYARPSVHARHILVKEKDLADNIVKEIAAGKDFADLAKAHSTDPGSKDSGGDLGWFDQARMIPPFSEAAFALQPGQVSGVVETRFGFHIIQVLERREETPLAEVREEIVTALEQNAVETLMRDLQASMKFTPGPGMTGKPSEGAAPEGASAEAAPSAPPAPAPAPH